eukprot:869878-Pyramimonas_sp.AAC.1
MQEYDQAQVVYERALALHTGTDGLSTLRTHPGTSLVPDLSLSCTRLYTRGYTKVTEEGDSRPQTHQESFCLNDNDDNDASTIKSSKSIKYYSMIVQ